MRITFWQSAEDHERYAPHAFDRCVGQTVPWTFKETEHGPAISRLGEATVVAVEVADDGSGATWTVDVPDSDRPLGGSGVRMSFSIPEIPAHWWE